MTASFLSRKALARVLTSLLKSEMKAVGLSATANVGDLMASDEWPEELQMAGDTPHALACDSLDLLRLAAAVNEMFHLSEAEQEIDLLSAGVFGSWLESIEAAWANGVGRITFMTSGSTGRPKRCTHNFSHLQAEARYLGEVFGDRTRIIPLAPSHHIYGFLFNAMLPDQLGQEIQASRDARKSRLVENLRGGDLVVTFPERWQWLHRTIAQWPCGVAGVVSTAPCPPDLAMGLMERGLESFTEVYGSSETAGLALRRWPESRYRLMPHWTVETVGDSEGALLKHSSGLQVRVKDHLELDDSGDFRLAGRIDEAVQVGGINVYPTRIAALIRDQPGVSDASVRLSALENGGRLKAFVVPQPQMRPAELRRRLEDWINGTLVSVERPRSLTFGDSLPKDSMGKDSDW